MPQTSPSSTWIVDFGRAHAGGVVSCNVNNLGDGTGIIWSKEWAEYMQARLLWDYEAWKTQCNSPLPLPLGEQIPIVLPEPLPDDNTKKSSPF